jgi:large subunit ribosomal protein L25
VHNALLEIVLDGKEQLALAKDVQRDPVRGDIEHVDLIIVRRGEKVTVDVSVHVVGDAEPDTGVNLDAQTIELEVLATNIPEHIDVSIEGLRAGTQIHASDLVLPEGASLAGDPGVLVLAITQAQSAEAMEAELAEAEAEAGIEHEAHVEPGAEPAPEAAEPESE